MKRNGQKCENSLKTKKNEKIQMYYFRYPFFSKCIILHFFLKFSVKTGFQLFICVKQLKFLLFKKKT
jgi:hypothetical protein